MVAAAIVHALRKPSARGRHRVDVRPRSGEQVLVSFTVNGGGAPARIRDVVLDGPARQVFEGVVEWPLRRTS
jgi:hypothetical protein